MPIRRAGQVRTRRARAWNVCLAVHSEAESISSLRRRFVSVTTETMLIGTSGGGHCDRRSIPVVCSSVFGFQHRIRHAPSWYTRVANGQPRCETHAPASVTKR